MKEINESATTQPVQQTTIFDPIALLKEGALKVEKEMETLFGKSESKASGSLTFEPLKVGAAIGGGLGSVGGAALLAGRAAAEAVKAGAEAVKAGAEAGAKVGEKSK